MAESTGIKREDQLKKHLSYYKLLYRVCENGDVFTRPKKAGKGRGFIRPLIKLKPFKDKAGYMQIVLCINCKHKTFLLHRLIALVFIPNPENKPCVNHKDGNKANNNVENLEWCTYSENERHAIRTGLKKNKGLGKSIITQEIQDGIFRLKKDGMSQYIIAEIFNTCQPTISKILTGKIKV